MVEWLGRWVSMRLPRLHIRFNLWFGFVSGCTEFNSPTLRKWPTGCLLPVGVLNHVSVKSESFLLA